VLARLRSGALGGLRLPQCWQGSWHRVLAAPAQGWDQALPRQPAESASSRPVHLPDSWHGNQTPAIFGERHF